MEQEMGIGTLSCLRELRTCFGCVSLYFHRRCRRYWVKVQCLLTEHSAKGECSAVFITLKVSGLLIAEQEITTGALLCLKRAFLRSPSEAVVFIVTGRNVPKRMARDFFPLLLHGCKCFSIRRRSLNVGSFLSG